MAEYPVPYPDPTRDRFVRRSGTDYAQAFLTLLPRGQAWPKQPGSTLERACTGLSLYWGTVDSRAAHLLTQESDPRKTVELLPDWERAWGLPDPCFPEVTSIGDRQRMLVLYMTWFGGQSITYFTELMRWLGYEITIREYAPFMAGVSRVGDTRPAGKPNENFRWYIGPPEMRFVWTVNVGTPKIVWFRAGSGRAGVDPHCRVILPDDLSCLLERWKPAQTDLAFDFSRLAAAGPMQGTPGEQSYGMASALGIASGVSERIVDIAGAASGVGSAMAVFPAASSGMVLGSGVGVATTFIREAAPTASFDGLNNLVVLSNNNLTVTHDNTTGNAGAISTLSRVEGNRYFEIKALPYFATDSNFAGIISSAFNGMFSATQMMTNGTVVQTASSLIYSNGLNTGISLGTLVAGDVYCFAFNLTIRRGWIRRNNGLWNNNAAANPATGVGGVAIAPTLTFAPVVRFASTASVNEAMTGYFGASAYAFPPPAGFMNW